MRVVFFPGWATTPAIFDPLASRLPPAEALRVDYGFFEGAPEPPPPLEIDALARLAEGPPCAAVGCSLGALPAIRAAARLPNVRALAVISGFARFTASDGRPGRPPEELDRMAAQLARSPEALLRVFYATLAAPSRVRFKQPGIPCVGRLLVGLRLLKEADAWDDARRVRAPTLVLHGSEDAVAPAACARALADAIPGARLVEFPGAGHGLLATHAEECARLLAPLLADA